MTVPIAPDHEVAVIGAGLGGIGMGIALREAGITDFVIFERAGDIGGTWRDNVEVTHEATDRWTARMRGRLERSLFQTNSCATANSYYFDHHGDTPFLRPTSSAQARRAARAFPLDDYPFTRPDHQGDPDEKRARDTAPDLAPQGAHPPDRVRVSR